MTRWLAGLLLVLAMAASATAGTPGRNVIVFVADGLRYGIVNADTAPTLAAIQATGVDFRNSHSLYPTVTTANASAIATGHGIGDTGEWSNGLYFGEPLPSANGRPTSGMESDLSLKDANARYGGNYLNETSLLRMARDSGYLTAAIGKEGPVLIQDISAADGKSTIVLDDSTGSDKPNRAVPLDPVLSAAIAAAGLPLSPPARGDNGQAGDFQTPGAHSPNTIQQAWFTAVTTEVILPRFAASGRPFAMVYWSRDPDGSQHNEGDSLNRLSPGINGPTGLAGVRDASDNLQALIDELKALGLYDNTDIFVTADHGFSTVTRQNTGSYAATLTYPDTIAGFDPQGYAAIDLAHALAMTLHDDTGKPLDATAGLHPKGTALIGADPAHPDIVAAGGGGSQILYLDPAGAKALAPRIVRALSRQSYVAAIFVDDGLGPVRGALPFSAAGLEGSALTPRPAIYVSFRDYALPACVAAWRNPELCSILSSDSGEQQGQGQHGALTRANTRNFMAAMGPDFKAGYADLAPVSNADITPTLARILGFTPAPKGGLAGRVIAEALKGGPATTASTRVTRRSKRAANGFVTVLEAQKVGDETYLDAAGMPGRVVGLRAQH